MAWFKLNDSLNSLKGQISNVVQEAFTEGVGQDENDRQQTDAMKQIESLQSLCGSQESEVSYSLKFEINLVLPINKNIHSSIMRNILMTDALHYLGSKPI